MTVLVAIARRSGIQAVMLAYDAGMTTPVLPRLTLSRCGDSPIIQATRSSALSGQAPSTLRPIPREANA